MFKLIVTAIIQSAFLAFAQFFMKIGMDRVLDFDWTAAFFKSVMNWQFGLSLLLYIIAMIIYMFMLTSCFTHTPGLGFGSEAAVSCLLSHQSGKPHSY